jgi:hypothetical protein
MIYRQAASLETLGVGGQLTSEGDPLPHAPICNES